MNRRSMIAAGLCTLALAGGGCADMPFGMGGWETLLDGTSGLENWNRIGGANWHPEDGAIVADSSSSKGSSFLMTKKSYSDFELRIEFWVSHDANSGIYMRCSNLAKVTDRTCYEANIFDQRKDPSYGTGAIVHLAKISPMPKAGGKWNVYQITAKGDHMVLVLNGARTAEARDAKFKSGPIGLQYAAGVVKFRKVQIRPL